LRRFKQRLFCFAKVQTLKMTAALFTSIAVLFRILSNPFANLFQKKLTSKQIHPLVVNFQSYFLLSIVCILFSFFAKWNNLNVQFWVFSVIVGMLGALGNGFLIKALKDGELSVLGPINSYKSVIGLIFGIFLLGEFPNTWGIFGMALIIFGSYFVFDSTDERFSWALLNRKDIQYRFLAMLFTAIEAVFIKKVILYSSPAIAFFSWCWFGTIFSFLILFLFGLDLKHEISISYDSNFLRYMLLVICIGTMQFSTNYAFSHMPVGYALSLFQLSAIVSILLGHKIFNEKDIRKKLIGSTIMIAGSIVIILLK
jgi:drug/metabolite transporter (DMT)-like permease